ncbi:hypothetical protein [Halomonas elongata]|uniref:hypothetical protein n=1 Tax=Halomonas elongata TaxID=2746 RepID=UPI0023B12AAF|nr:hypothetical protein [Halomonas elongata]
MKKWAAVMVAAALAGCTDEGNWKRDAKGVIDDKFGTYPSLDSAFIVESEEHANLVAVCGTFSINTGQHRFNERRFVVTGFAYGDAILSNTSLYIDDLDPTSVPHQAVDGPKGQARFEATSWNLYCVNDHHPAVATGFAD